MNTYYGNTGYQVSNGGTLKISYIFGQKSTKNQMKLLYFVNRYSAESSKFGRQFRKKVYVNKIESQSQTVRKLLF